MENMKLQTRRLTNLIMISMIVFGVLLRANMISAQRSPIEDDISTNLPGVKSNVVIFNNTAPVIDGSLESFKGEWDDAVEYSTQFGEESYTSVSIRVKANYTHLFIAVEYITTVYVEINTTVPVGDTYNNQSHNWYAIVFDQNFDNIIGSKLTPEDAVVVNYRLEGAVDAYINGTKENSLVEDSAVGGFNNSIAALVAEQQDIPTEYKVTFEIAKELNSGDAPGNDISLEQNDVIRFKLLAWENKTAIYNTTILNEVQTPWLSFQLERLYEVFSYVSDFSNVNVTVYVSDSANTDEENLTTVYYMLEAYGFNVSVYSDTDTNIDETPLNHTNLLIMIGAHTKLATSEVEAVRSFVSSGGSLLILGDTITAESKLNNLLTKFGFEFYNASLVSKNPATNTTLTINTPDFVNLPYLTEDVVLSNNSLASIPYQGSAINISAGIGEGRYLYQEGDLYPVANVSGDYYIDLDKDFQFNKTVDVELNDSAVVQIALELQRGGKLIACASADLFNSSNIVNPGIKTLLLRELTWLLNMQFRIHYDNFNVLQSKVNFGDAINVNITISSDNNTIPSDVRVWAVAMELKSDIDKANLTVMDNQGNYNGSIIPEHAKGNYIDISIRMHKRGYGYNETGLVEITLIRQVEFNMKVDPISAILFFASIGLAVVGGFAIKRYKPVKVEDQTKEKKK